MANKDENMEGMPVGLDDFRKLRDLDSYFVDKTPLIDMVLKSLSDVKLFTRPRRFGKSLNMSMLDAYLNIRYAGERDRFSDLKIASIRPNDPEKNSNYVISMSLKDLDTEDFEAFIHDFADVMRVAYKSFGELDDSENLDDVSREIYRAVVRRKAERNDLAHSIKHLCEMIESHYGKKPIILIDEYDNPMNGSYGNDEVHEKIKSFLRKVYGSALKGNTHMRFAVLTGVTRVSKESIFSGVNNFRVYDLFDKQYDEMFGFTQAEVEKLLADNGHPEKIAEAKEWYDGYRFGNADVFNPWSILMYVDTGFEAASHWASTSGNSIIGDLLCRTDSETWEKLEKLCAGGTTTAKIRREIAYCDLHSSDAAIFSMMVATGYLNAVFNGEDYTISIPNREMVSVFRESVLERFGDNVNKHLNGFLKAIKTGDVPTMTTTLTDLMEALSVRILTSEFPYEAFITGLVIRESPAYEILDDREAGEGYYDIRMKRISGPGPNVIMELKRLKDDESGKNDDVSREKMEKLAREAIGQIHENRYYSGMNGTTYLYGIAFKGKVPTIVMEKL